MRDQVNRFYNSFENIEKFDINELIELFIYFLTEELGHPEATSLLLRKCFSDCDLQIPSSLSVKLSRGTTAKENKYIKTEKGYRLNRAIRDRISRRRGVEKVEILPNDQLRELEVLIIDPIRKNYLQEALACFDIQAYRASIIMAWILSIDHLYDYILRHKLAEFNKVLAANNDKRIKLTAITVKDDFSEIPEGKFIEFARASNVISNDVRKILDQKLGVRNSAAHPSGVLILKNKAIDFVEDLITNVVLKYNI